MKRKRFDYRNWHRATSGEQTTLQLPGGLLVDYRAGEVTKPLRVPFRGRELLILETGYRWVHFSPTGQKHALTVQLDGAGVPQQLYVDIGEGTGVGEDGLPYIDDLYLDVIALCEVQPGGTWHVTETEIIDGDELEDALQRGAVSLQQAEGAWQAAREVEAALLGQAFAPLETVRRYLSDPYT